MKALDVIGVLGIGIGAILLMFGNGLGVIGLVIGGVCITDPSYQK